MYNATIQTIVHIYYIKVLSGPIILSSHTSSVSITIVNVDIYIFHLYVHSV